LWSPLRRWRPRYDVCDPLYDVCDPLYDVCYPLRHLWFSLRLLWPRYDVCDPVTTFVTLVTMFGTLVTTSVTPLRRLRLRYDVCDPLYNSCGPLYDVCDHHNDIFYPLYDTLSLRNKQIFRTQTSFQMATFRPVVLCMTFRIWRGGFRPLTAVLSVKVRTSVCSWTEWWRYVLLFSSHGLSLTCPEHLQDWLHKHTSCRLNEMVGPNCFVTWLCWICPARFMNCSPLALPCLYFNIYAFRQRRCL